jgi:type 1 glutamine amidotransferase
MNKTGISLCLWAALGVCCVKAAAGEPGIRVLIVDGFSNHDWRHTTECIQAILNQAGGFNVSVSTFPESEDAVAAWHPDFHAFDAVIQTCNDIQSGTQWPARVQQALEGYVRQGGGLFVFHSGNNAFPDWTEYNRMIGLGWRGRDFGRAVIIGTNGAVRYAAAGEGENTGHGKRVDARLTRLGDHPVHAGLPRQWIAADIEIYRYARGPAENLSVLSFARDEQTGLNFPVEWTVQYGRGRVYNSTFGHVWKNQQEPAGICCAGFQTVFIRSLQWLAGREVDPSVPGDFPLRERSLRPYPLK